ncbi:hypothetical protein BGZ98_004602, partial [Dissophora globulifera]
MRYVLFGGKIVVFGGDFRQVLPAVMRESEQQTGNGRLKNSRTIWLTVEILMITQNMMAVNHRENQAFIECLPRIRERTEPTVVTNNPNVRIPELHFRKGEPITRCLAIKNWLTPSLTYIKANENFDTFIARIKIHINNLK